MKTVIIIFNCLLGYVLYSQNITITDDPSYTADPSAVLDVKSNSLGFLVPRVSQEQRDGIQNPAKGLMIYQMTDPEGFYYNKGTPSIPDWEFITGKSKTLWLKGPLNSTTLLSNTADSVGIGTLSPEEKLDVQGNMILDNFMPLILFREDSIPAARIQHFGSPGMGYLQLQAWDGYNFETTGLVVHSISENVGIGITDPLYKLDVSGITRTSGFILSTPTSDGYILTSDSTGLASWQQLPQRISGTGTANYVPRFETSDSLTNSVIYQTESGLVGIGTTNPTNRLDINGKLNVRGNIATLGHWLSADGTNEGVYVNNDGNVGIGISSPLTSKLTTNGLVEAKTDGFKFPDGTVQATAAYIPPGPYDAAYPRWVVGMEIPEIPGDWNYEEGECAHCIKVLDFKWPSYINWDINTTSMQGPRLFDKVTIIKNIDIASLPLLQRYYSHGEIDYLNLKFYVDSLYHSDAPPVIQSYYEIRFSGVRLINFTQKDDYSGNEVYRHTEEISFFAEHIEWYWRSNNQTIECNWLPR